MNLYDVESCRETVYKILNVNVVLLLKNYCIKCVSFDFKNHVTAKSLI